MNLTAQQRTAFERACKPLFTFLQKPCHPHVTLVLRRDHAQFVEGLAKATRGPRGAGKRVRSVLSFPRYRRHWTRWRQMRFTRRFGSHLTRENPSRTTRISDGVISIL